MEEHFEEFLKRIETKWQQRWAEKNLFEADPKENQPKYFITFPYPYVNGSVHLGHGYTILKADFLARYKRMKGFNVLFPQGFHATGEPIVGMAKRLAEGDESQKNLLKAFGVKDEDIKAFEDPKYIVGYFVDLMKKDMKSIGLSIDWRRSFITTDLTPTYSAFIRWQYLTLKELGYVGKGSHPVIYCPQCQSATGDHDRLEGEGATVAEMIALKFPYEDGFMLPATLRPETIYGVTNMYLGPDFEYVKIKVDDKEIWYVTRETIQKIIDQDHQVEEISSHKGHEFFGKYCKNPVTGHDILILPAHFIDPESGTGVVMSVPSHAPVDWVAIKNLQDNPRSLEGYGVTAEQILAIKPIALIKLEGYGEHPAIEIIEKMGITDQNDPQVETATKTIYKKEFHAGVTTEITGKYAGTPVRDIKDVLINDFIEENIATILYESSEKVVCRCGTTCHVKMFKDQWFLKFGDFEWKQKVRNQVEKMLFLPPEGKAAFDYTIDWLHDKACTRRSGLGTPLPWDPTWIVETLSDSTIYMAYYTLAKYVTSGDLTVEQATVEFFNYIFRGIGEPNSISQQINMSKDKLEEMRAEFCYWYPMDIRISGKDLIHNHLTFCLFHHAALFDTDLQPRGMGVNGHMSVEGQKMSKSKGVLTPLNEATQVFGADLTRIGLLGAGESLSDAKFAENDVKSYARWLESLYRYSMEKPVSQKMNFIDHWLLSRLQTHISTAEGHAENLRTRSYLQTVLFDLINDLRWYRRRSFEIGPAFPEAVETAIRLLTPITPHFSEEIWEISDNKGFIATTPFPEADVGKKAPLIETQDLFLRSVMADIDKIRQALKKDNFSRIDIILSSQWMYTVRDMVEESKEDLIKRIMQINEIKSQGKRAISYAQKILNSPSEFPTLTRENEENALTSAKDFLSQHYSTEINVLFAENSDSSKAKIAEPGRPGINFIFIE